MATKKKTKSKISNIEIGKVFAVKSPEEAAKKQQEITKAGFFSEISYEYDTNMSIKAYNVTVIRRLTEYMPEVDE